MGTRTKRFESKRLITPGADDGKTLQSQQDSTDINKLLHHYRKTGTFTHMATEMPQYGDFSNVGDFLQVQLQVKACESLFMECSADVRARFSNNPAEMLDFLADPRNAQEAINLGLAEGEIVPIEPAVQAEPASSQPDAGQAEPTTQTPPPDSPVQGGE